MPLSHKQLAQAVTESLNAALLNDADGATAAVQPIFTDGTPADGLRWVLALVVVAEGKPRRIRKGAIRQPIVTLADPKTGQAAEVPIDEAPPGVAAYARIRAAWANKTPDVAADVWEALLNDPGDELARCMTTALTEARNKILAQLRG